MQYLLDTNVFIQAKNLHYGLDFCPAFWDWLVEQNDRGIVHSIDKVGDELIAGDDELVEWAKKCGAEFFLPPDASILPALGTVSSWVSAQNYRSTAKNTFFQDTDYYLIAYAMAQQCTVVTHEIASDGIKTVKIPNVCLGVRVKFMTPYEMLRRERARFVLGSVSS